MNTMSETSNQRKHQLKYLWFLTLCFAMAYVISNWYSPRFVSLFGLSSGGGIIIFPMTYLLSDLITEVYGYKNARIAIWSGFAFNLIFISYGWLISHLAAPSNATSSVVFDKMIDVNTRMIIASGISYVCSESINSIIVSKLKIWIDGRLVGLRFLLSTIFSAGFDTFLFCFLAFFGEINNKLIISAALGAWFLKVCVELIGLPLSTWLAVKLKQLERIDIYDRQTEFNPFSLDVQYAASANEFRG